MGSSYRGADTSIEMCRHQCHLVVTSSLITACEKVLRLRLERTGLNEKFIQRCRDNGHDLWLLLGISSL